MTIFIATSFLYPFCIFLQFLKHWEEGIVPIFNRAEDADACPAACNDDVSCCLDWVAAGETIAATSLAEARCKKNHSTLAIIGHDITDAFESFD